MTCFSLQSTMNILRWNRFFFFSVVSTFMMGSRRKTDYYWPWYAYQTCWQCQTNTNVTLCLPCSANCVWAIRHTLHQYLHASFAKLSDTSYWHSHCKTCVSNLDALIFVGGEKGVGIGSWSIPDNSWSRITLQIKYSL